MKMANNKYYYVEVAKAHTSLQFTPVMFFFDSMIQYQEDTWIILECYSVSGMDYLASSIRMFESWSWCFGICEWKCFYIISKDIFSPKFLSFKSCTITFLHLSFGLPLFLLTAGFFQAIFFILLLFCVLVRRPNHCNLLGFTNCPIGLSLNSSSSSVFVLLPHASSVYFPPKILVNIFVSWMSNFCWFFPINIPTLLISKYPLSMGKVGPSTYIFD